MGYSTSSSDDDDYKSKKRHKKQSKKSKSKRKKEKTRKTKRDRLISSSSSESEAEWVEKEIPNQVNLVINDSSTTSITENKPYRSPTNDTWSNFDSFIPTYSNSAKQVNRQAKKDWNSVRSVAKPGQHSRELNPYWKNEGNGLPPADKVSNTEKTAESVVSPGDGGLYWLRKAYERAKEQAKEEGRNLEDVACERWGSLSNFYALLEKAEEKAKHKDFSQFGSGAKSLHPKSFKKPKRDSSSSSNEDSTNVRYKPQNNLESTRQPTWMKKALVPTATRSSEQHQQSVVPSSSPSNSGTNMCIEKLAKKSTSPEPPPSQPAVTVLSDQEMNSLSAKILKAEILGNAELVTELKLQYSDAESKRIAFLQGGARQSLKEPGKKVVTKILMDGKSHRRDKPSDTYRDGQRVRYFPDDDKQSLQNMFQREKTNTVEDENALFSRLAGKGMKSKPTVDYDLDDIFVDKASSLKKAEKEKEREVKKIITEEKFYDKKIDNCPWCFDGRKLEKHIVASIADKSYICLPPFQSLTEGHCLIVPMNHVSAGTALDEDVWEEMQKFRRALVRMFKEDDQDLIIFESVMALHHHPHMYLECVPIPKETGELAPIYFKKAIQECESEWSQNKKLVELKNGGVRRAIPKGLPYFSVDFGDDSGFAHVIEDEKSFPRNFAQEIIGGMMELDHSLWRKRRNDTFKDQREKVMKFLEMWGPFDWTRDV